MPRSGRCQHRYPQPFATLASYSLWITLLVKVFAASREPFKTLLKAMTDSGCRPSENCGPKVVDCFPDASVWLVENKMENQTGVKKRPIYRRRPTGKTWSPPTARLFG